MTPTPEPPPEFLLKLARIAESDPNSVTVQEQELLEWVDSLTRQRDEALRHYDEQQIVLQSAFAMAARVEALCASWAPDPGSIRAHCAEDVRAALAVTAPPETEDVDLSKTQQWTEKTFRLDLEHPDSSIPILPDEDFECCSAPPKMPEQKRLRKGIEDAYEEARFIVEHPGSTNQCLPIPVGEDRP